MHSVKTAFKRGLQYISHAASALGCLVAAATPHAIPWPVKVEPWHVEVKLFHMLLHWTPSGSPLKFQVSAFSYSPVPHHRQPTGAQQAIAPRNVEKTSDRRRVGNLYFATK